jgi:uncharacterized protein
MIQGAIVKKLAREWKIKAEDMEKHYVLGWVLWGIQETMLKEKLIFKGGTAISKIYFPSSWRLSEDLDFTLADDVDWSTIISILDDELPGIVQKASGITLRRKEKDKPHVNDGYLQYKIRYVGPLYSGMMKIEITKESFIGDIENKPVPNDPGGFDYPKFSIPAYSLETIMGEKMRAMLERGYIRDYYDVWRLLKEKRFDQKKAKNMFLEKCKAKEIKFSRVDDFFPEGKEKELETYLPNLTRLLRDPLPPINTIFGELKKQLEIIVK